MQWLVSALMTVVLVAIVIDLVFDGVIDAEEGEEGEPWDIT